MVLLLLVQQVTGFSLPRRQTNTPRVSSESQWRVQQTAINDGETNDTTFNVTTGSLLPKDFFATDLPSVDDSLSDILLPLDSLTSLNQPTDSETNKLSRISETMSESIILALATFGVSYLLGDLLVQFEWLQDWLYFWPLVGTLYVAEPMMKQGLSLLPFALSKNPAIQLLSVIGGVFTLIGGAYDAFMPVWQTGPNIFTIAGIGQDGAVILLLVSVISIIQESWNKYQAMDAKYNLDSNFGKDNGSSSNQMLLQILLLAELYKLGESSVDEIVSGLDSVSKSIGG